MFSSRLPPDLRRNRLAEAAARRRQADRPILDLTISNPTCAGIDYPPDMLGPLADATGLVYSPSPLGLDAARDAVAADYARRGIVVASERVVLTASTSEAYSFLFKVLCEPAGSSVIAPAPSYPLFDHLARLDGLGLSTYSLEYHGRWVLDERSVDAAWTESLRAVLAVSPNNPTGSVLTSGELRWLMGRAAERGAALILDEVFADYPLDTAGPAAAGGARPHADAGPCDTPPCLVFRLGGLSKSIGLPQVKLGWIAVEGPDALTGEALARLELVADTYLSVGTPVQLAAPALISAGERVRAAIQARVRGNWRRLVAACAAAPSIELLQADAGWSAVVRVPATRTDEDLALALLEEDSVLVHPGYLFDFAGGSYLVVSLLPEPSTFDEGVRRVLERARA